MFEPSFLASHGLPGLFVWAFLAGSVVPIPSEVAMVALLVGGVEPVPTVAVAAAGNFLGAATLFWLGRRIVQGGGGKVDGWMGRIVRADPERLRRSVDSVRKWGGPALLLSWLPIVGDVLVIAAGMIGLRVLPFVVFTGVGKTIRFTVVAWTALAAAGL